MLEEKYAELLEMGQEHDFSNWEEGGKLFIKGMAPFQLDKDLFWDKIKTYDNWENEIAADITVESTEHYGFYTVKPGDSLSVIAKWHLGNPMKYMDIFNLNTDILDDPNRIGVGQKLKLPNR